MTATTTNQFYTIANALKYTNYTISILAFTSIGDGVKTKNIYCITHEDGKKMKKFIEFILTKTYFHVLVPSAPQNIKAIPSSNTKIIVSWMPPEFRNGEIVSFSTSHE